MLGVFAEFETNLRRERQAEGIAAAKQRGAYRGRPPRIDMEAIRHRLAIGLSPTAVARVAGRLTRNRLQGQGGHDGPRVMRSTQLVFAPGNVVVGLEM